MKRVLHLLTSNRFGGAENIAMSICNGLDRNYDFAYASPTGDIDEILAEKRIDHIALNVNDIAVFRTAVKKFNPSIIHAHDFKASFLANLLFNKIPVISHIHQAPDWQGRINIKSLSFLYIAHKSSRVIYVSNKAKDSYIFNKHLVNTDVIENGLNLRQIDKLSKNFDSGHFDVLFVGRLDPVKNPEMFVNIALRIIKKVPSLKVGILGDGTLRERIREKVKKVSQIKLLGFKNNPYPYISQADIVLSTSKSDAFGLTMIEAAYLGAIPVAPNIGGISETTKKVNGFVYDDEENVVNFLARLLGNEKLLRERKCLISKTDFTHYDESRYLSDIRHVYEEVLQK